MIKFKEGISLFPPFNPIKYPLRYDSLALFFKKDWLLKVTLQFIYKLELLYVHYFDSDVTPCPLGLTPPHLP